MTRYQKILKAYRYLKSRDDRQKQRFEKMKAFVLSEAKVNKNVRKIIMEQDDEIKYLKKEVLMLRYKISETNNEMNDMVLHFNSLIRVMKFAHVEQTLTTPISKDIH